MSADGKRIGTNTGHGHVWTRPDGIKARCGGAGICSQCATDLVEEMKNGNVVDLLLSQRTDADETEKAASKAHEQWSHWQRYLHSQCYQGEDGMLIIPACLVRRWDRQMNTPYEQLSEEEKESDRSVARKFGNG